MKTFPVIDLHEDISAYILESRHEKIVKPFNIDSKRHADIPKYSKGNVVLVVGAAFPGEYKYIGGKQVRGTIFRCASQRVMDHIAVYYRLVREFPESLYLVEHRDELLKLERNKGTGIIIGLEGAYPLDDPWDIELYYKLGVRFLGLTWNVENRYAASCLSKRDYGLTGSGEELVDLAERYGIVVDLAHASRRTMLDVLSIANKPVVISHACVRKLRDHPRNVDDEVLEELRKNHGVIGVTFVADFLGGEGVNVDTVVDHVIYLYENFGVDIIAIGTDYLGTTRLPEGLEDISRIQTLFKKLIEKGLSVEDVEKIAWKNAYRVLLEVLR